MVKPENTTKYSEKMLQQCIQHWKNARFIQNKLHDLAVNDNKCKCI